MRCNKKNMMPLILFGMIILMMGSVLATITYTGVTDRQTIRQDTTIGYSSNQTNVRNITLTITDPQNNVIVLKRTEANISSYTIVFNDLVANTYTYQGNGFNVTNHNVDIGASGTFTITGCTPMNYALWGIVMLVFVVGLLYFAYNGFIEGHAGSIISFLIMLTVAVVVVGSFSLTVLRPLC